MVIGFFLVCYALMGFDGLAKACYARTVQIRMGINDFGGH